ncbi:GatB/YqeY domain-containing protein, partial [bacterium]|nr:GatB/YqeY domain-containing protein [bacterium]
AINSRVGAKGPSDRGRVMGIATKELAGRAEGREISAKVMQLLG